MVLLSSLIWGGGVSVLSADWSARSWGLTKDLHLAKRYYDMAKSQHPDALIPVTLAKLKLTVHSWYESNKEYLHAWWRLAETQVRVQLKPCATCRKLVVRDLSEMNATVPSPTKTVQRALS